MKALFLAMALLCSIRASADPACSALSTVVGVYKQVSKTCDFANSTLVFPYIQVQASAVIEGSSGVEIWYATTENAKNVFMGITATVSPNDLYLCSESADKVILRDCGIDARNWNCRPGAEVWNYSFSPGALDVTELGCTAHYLKMK